MPSSNFYQIDRLSEIIFSINPESTLDVGVGFGKYGYLIREYVDIWRDGQFRKFKRRLDGIEAFEKYINPAHKFIYNKIYVGDALSLLPKIKTKYDLAILIDCLEHFSCTRGLRLLKLLSKKSKTILVSTPKKMQPQGAVFGNIYEQHVYQWKKDDFLIFPEVAFFGNSRSLICIIGKNSKLIAKKITKERIKDDLQVNFPFLKDLMSALFR